MQLAYLLPHLDAEIERLQKARDLLAYTPPSWDLFEFSSPTVTINLLTWPLADEEAERRQDSKPAAPSSIASMPPAQAATVITRVRRRRTPRTGLHADKPHTGSRKRLILPDTALGGPVPSGPVVVSAEEVRKSQALKSAQSSRAAEVRKAGDELVSSFHWRSRNSDGRSMDSLLQKLMNIGEDTGPGSAGQLSSLGHNGDFKAAHEALSSKLD